MAYQDADIIALAKQAFDLWKKANPQSYLKNAKHKVVLPEYYPGYTMAVEYAEHIRDHAIVGRFPGHIFSEASPNQSPREFDYMKKIYKQITLPVHIDYLSTVTRGDNPNNVSVEYQKDDTAYEGKKSLQEYLEKGIKDYGSLELWRKTVLPSLKSIDGCGVIVIKPYYIPTITQPETADVPEQTFIDPENLLEPIPYYYGCEKVVSCETDEYYLIELDEKSMVNMGGAKDEPFGKVYEFIDEQNIWRVEQYGKYNDGLFKTSLYFNHAEGELPVTPLMGIPINYEGRILWQSPFLYSCDLLDLAALNHTNLQVSINTCVYPYPVAIGSVCNFEYTDSKGQIDKCNDGLVFDSILGRHIMCPSCEGAGLKDRRSRLGVLLLKPGTTREPGEESFKNKPLEFISPEVHSLEFIEDKIEKDLEKARQILHLHTSNSTVKGSQDMKVTGMALDSQAMQAFVKTVSDQTFDIYRFTVDRIGWQRYGDAYKKPTIIAPSIFEFLTDQDYMQQVADAVKAQLPPFMIRSIILNYLRAVFYDQKDSLAVYEIVTHADRILTMDSQDVAIALAKSTVAKWEVILHDSSVPLIQKLILEDENYLDLPLQDKIDKLIAKAKEIEAAIPEFIPITERITDQSGQLISPGDQSLSGNIIKSLIAPKQPLPGNLQAPLAIPPAPPQSAPVK